MANRLGILQIFIFVFLSMFLHAEQFAHAAEEDSCENRGGTQMLACPESGPCQPGEEILVCRENVALPAEPPPAQVAAPVQAPPTRPPCREVEGGVDCSKPGVSSAPGAPSAPVSNVVSVPGCQAISDAVELCSSKTATAEESSCNMKADTGVNASVRAFETLANQLQNASSQMAACAGLNDGLMKANAAMASFKYYCQVAETECTDACGEAARLIRSTPNSSTCAQSKDLVDLKLRCSRAGSSARAADDNIKAMAANKNISAQCKLMAQSGDICATSPNSQACLATKPINCADRAFASNKFCICAANPRDPVCGVSLPGGVAGGVQNNSATGANNSMNDSKLLNHVPDFGGGVDSGIGSGDFANGSQNGGGGRLGGGSTSGRNIGGGGDAPNTSGNKQQGGGGGGSKADPTRINAGYYGGGGGSAPSYGGSPGAGSGGNYGGSGGGRPNAQDKQKVDWRAWIPGGAKDASRQLAGVSGPDGVTGQSTDIWKKIKRPYSQLSKLMKP
jgi:hypothetical protein